MQALAHRALAQKLMSSSYPLHLFYEEPDPDRWVKNDHLPRRWIRRLLRGAPRPGGVKRWFLNLRAGLDEIGAQYRINDYRSLRRNPDTPALVIGKPQVIAQIPAGHPILFGPGVDDHPTKADFWERPDICRLVIPCDWFAKMYQRDLPRPIPISIWPAGIDTKRWAPPKSALPDRSAVLIYDKIRWDRAAYQASLINPINQTLRANGHEVISLRYGYYREEDYQSALQRVGAMVFLCEHETQGFAYLQALASDVPIIAWDRGGFWQDPQLYPDRVCYEPVTSVPYWTPQCGERFSAPAAWPATFDHFQRNLAAAKYQPREYVIRELNLAKQAQAYLEIVQQVSSGRR